MKHETCECSTLTVNANLARADNVNKAVVPIWYKRPTSLLSLSFLFFLASTSLPDCIILFACIALVAYRYPPQIYLGPIAQHHQLQWLSTPTKWIGSFGQSCHKLLKSCITSLHLKVSPWGRCCSYTCLTEGLGANEVLLGLNTVESKVAYLVQIIAIELYKASKAISLKVRFRPVSLRRASLTCTAEHFLWSERHSIPHPAVR